MLAIKLTNLLLVAIIVFAHFFAPLGYAIPLHTMSELAAQGVENRLILTFGFYIVGLLYIVFGYHYYRKKSLPLFLTITTIGNGLVTILIGVFPTSYDGYTHVAVNETIVIIHRYVAYVSQLLVIASMIYHVYKSKPVNIKGVHGVFIVSSFILASIFINIDPSIRGIFQRLLLINNTTWTVLCFGEFRQVKLHHLLASKKPERVSQ
jgi:hypothetical membrane protein